MIKLKLNGKNLLGAPEERYALFDKVSGETLMEKISSAGMYLDDRDNLESNFVIRALTPRSLATKVRLEPGFEVKEFYVSKKQPSIHFVVLITFICLALIYIMQKYSKRMIKKEDNE